MTFVPPRKTAEASEGAGPPTSRSRTRSTAAPPPAAPVEPAEPIPQPPAKLPGSVTAAAVLLLIFGTLAGLATAFMVFTLLMFTAIPFGPIPPIDCVPGDRACDFPMDPSFGLDAGFAFMGVASVAVMAIVGVAVTAGHIAAGIAILQRQGWARILGMVVSGAAVIVLVLSLGTTLMAALVPMPSFEDPMGAKWDQYYATTMAATLAFGTVVAVFVGAAYTYVLWVLARRGDVFE